MADLEEFLATFDERVEKALDAAADLIVELAQAKAPKRTGTLRDSIKKGRPGLYERTVSADAPYAEFVENGRRGFQMNGKVLRFVINGETIFRTSVGPQKAQPFMRPARNQVNQQVRRIFNAAFK